MKRDDSYCHEAEDYKSNRSGSVQNNHRTFHKSLENILKTINTLYSYEYSSMYVRIVVVWYIPLIQM